MRVADNRPKEFQNNPEVLYLCGKRTIFTYSSIHSTNISIAIFSPLYLSASSDNLAWVACRDTICRNTPRHDTASPNNTSGSNRHSL